MGRDRRRRPRRRPARLDRRHAPARQAQADLHPPHGLRRQRHRHQCRQGGAHRPASASRRSTTTTPAIRAASRSAPPAPSSTAASPSACGKGRRAHAAARPARPPAVRATCASTRAPSIRTRRRSPKSLDVGALNRKNVEGRLIMAETVQSLEATWSAPEAGRRRRSAEVRAEARRPGPRLRHRQAQGRGRPRLDQAGHRQDHRQRPRRRRLFRASGAAHDDRSSRSSSPNRDGQFDVVVHGRRAAACRARPARCATASPRR